MEKVVCASEAAAVVIAQTHEGRSIHVRCFQTPSERPFAIAFLTTVSEDGETDQIMRSIV